MTKPHKITRARLFGPDLMVTSSSFITLLCLFLATGCEAFRFLFPRSVPTSSSFALSASVHKVTLKKEGEVIAVLDVPEDQIVLDAAIDAGVDIPYDCKLGTFEHCYNHVSGYRLTFTHSQPRCLSHLPVKNFEWDGSARCRPSFYTR